MESCARRCEGHEGGRPAQARPDGENSRSISISPPLPRPAVGGGRAGRGNPGRVNPGPATNNAGAAPLHTQKSRHRRTHCSSRERLAERNRSRYTDPTVALVKRLAEINALHPDRTRMARENDRALEGVFEFAHIARPVMRVEARAGLWGEAPLYSRELRVL